MYLIKLPTINTWIMIRNGQFIKMRCMFLFGIGSLLILQNVASKGRFNYDIELIRPLNAENVRSIQNYREARSLKDVWNTIKKSAKNFWIAIKTIANNTKEKIKSWIQKAKCKADEIKLSFEERLKQVREKSKEIIEKLVGTGKIVKVCFEKDSADIEVILKKIISSVSLCVSSNLTHVSHIESHSYKVSDMNETKHFAEIETRMNACMEKPKTAEDCLHGVKKEVIADMENMETDVLRERAESRGLVDDFLDSITSCSVNGILDASKVIAAETASIVACVIKGQNMQNHDI